MVMQDLKVLLVQTQTIWERPQDNFTNLDQLLHQQPADLIVLPETFSTGFSMNAHALAETMDGPAVSWMKKTAKSFNAVITGSVIISSEGRFFNRLLWVSPDGGIEYYDKRHLFGLMGEDKDYSSGTERKVFLLGNWRICPQICYDLRFPVWCRNQDDYDVLLFVANWPTVRRTAWNILLHARAIENQCYVIATNRVGRDGNDLEFGGGSLVIDPLGKTLEELGSEQQISTVILQHAELTTIRSKLPFLKNRDSFLLAK